MGRAETDVLTVEQFLQLPEIKPPLEFVRGRVVQKVSPVAPHCKLGQTLWLWIYRHTLVHQLGECFLELRCTFHGESLVPDVVYFDPGRIPSDDRGEYIAEGMHQAPDLIVEIISPGQTVKALSSRLARCIAKGVRLAWMVQPRKRRAFVFRPGRPPETLQVGDELNGEDVLPGFRLALAEMFGWLAVGSKPFPA